MSYTVTATKMRPCVFGELSGQDFVATSLQKSVESGKIAHAYLFSGPRGVGKTSAARILAKAINCQNAKDGNPCCQCTGCREIAQGTSMDVIEIDGASNTSVNDVRQIKDEVLFAPVNSKYKVYIIDEVHMLSNSAFNALLKTVEEPPPYIVFIFATTEVHKVPATIRSRCQHFNFHLVHTDVICSLLKKVCTVNGIKISDDVLFWIAKESTGSLRDAYTLFDKVSAFGGDNVITMDLLKEKMGLAGFDRINELAECFADGNCRKALDILNDILSLGVAPEQFITELTEYFRNILLIKNKVTSEAVLGYPADSFSSKVINAFSVFQIEQALALVLQLYRDMRYSLSQRFELELLITRLSAMTDFISRQGLLEKIQNLKGMFVSASGSELPEPDIIDEHPENKTENPNDAMHAFIQRTSVNRETVCDKKIPVANDDVKTETAIKSPAVNEEKIQDMTAFRQKIIGNIRSAGNNTFLSGALDKTSEWEIADEIISIPCEDMLFVNRLKESLPLLLKEVESVLGRKYKIEIKHMKKNIQPEKNFSPEVNSKVDMVLHVFKGEIVDNKRG